MSVTSDTAEHVQLSSKAQPPSISDFRIIDNVMYNFSKANLGEIIPPLEYKTGKICRRLLPWTAAVAGVLLSFVFCNSVKKISFLLLLPSIET